MKKQYFLWLWCILCGWSLGHVIWWSQHNKIADASPSGWVKEDSPVPYRESSLQGGQSIEPQEWTLDFYQAIYPNEYATRQHLSLETRIPEQGLLEIWLSSPVIEKRMGDRWMDICKVRKNDPRCQGNDSTGTALIFHRLSNNPSAQFQIIEQSSQGSQRSNVYCDQQLPEINLDEKIALEIHPLENHTQVIINHQTLSCKIHWGDRIPMIRPGLRQIEISNLQWGSVKSTHLSNTSYWIESFLGILFLLGLGWWHHRTSRFSSILLSTFPLLGGFYWASFESKIFIEDLRAAWLSPYWLSTYFTVLPTIMLQLGLLSFRKGIQKSDIISGVLSVFTVLIIGWQSSWIAALTGLIPLGIGWGIMQYLGRKEAGFVPVMWSSVFGILLALTQPFHWAGVFWAMIGGLAIALIILFNRFTVRGFNFWSLAFFVVLMVSMETTLRATPAGRQWSSNGSNTQENEIFGWIRQANESFALFDEGQHTTYPDKGFPIQIQSSENRTRIIAFGGSTTGGAFQNDNLNEFYPALLQQELQNATAIDGSKNSPLVLNQGVGGWTTWHIARYFEQKQESLQADIITLYVGHNDILTAIPMTYKELYPIWMANKGNKETSQWLSQFRLYHGLRYLLVSLKKSENKVAVPIPHAKENLESIIAMAPNSKIILISEGLSPEPGILAEYNTMLQNLAESHPNVSYLPIAEKLAVYPPGDIFLDDCHLTYLGHSILAHDLSLHINSITSSQ